jgi:hypothetical protein
LEELTRRQGDCAATLTDLVRLDQNVNQGDEDSVCVAETIDYELWDGCQYEFAGECTFEDGSWIRIEIVAEQQTSDGSRITGLYNIDVDDGAGTTCSALYDAKWTRQ